jgi:hypothetical protein
MLLWLIIVSATLFFFHLLFETLGSFIKYNLSSHRRQMTGVSWANILAIVSRGFVALFGVFVAAIVEAGSIQIGVYSLVFSFVLILAGSISLFLSRRKISEEGLLAIECKKLSLILNPIDVLDRNDNRLPRPVNSVVAVLMGTQFVAILIAYGLCFLFPERRLLVISMVPVVSMLGTMITFVVVEPAFAKIIDQDNQKGYAVSREFLKARATSFFASAVLFFSMAVFFSDFQ